MKKVLFLAAASLVCICARAQEYSDPFGVLRPRNPLSFEYSSDFDYYFENREFDFGTPSPMESSTVHGVVLSPSAGFGLHQGNTVSHRLTVGMDIRRNMGEGPLDIRVLDELTMHYDGHLRLRNGAVFEGILGVFPRRFSEGEYGEAFFSDAHRFQDRNLDGTLLKYRAVRFYAEIGADWLGMKKEDSRERFMILSAGNWKVAPWMELGWAGTFYHYAGSETVRGVVDNNLVNPYVRVDLAGGLPMQELSLKAGGLLSYQWDRRQDGKRFPAGVQAIFTARKWNVLLRDTFYRGDVLQIYYNDTDLAGNLYGSALYFGSPFYQCGRYNLLEAGWNPWISDCISLDIRFRFHFGAGGFMGWQQQLGFLFDLDRIRHPDWGAGRTGKARMPRRHRNNGNLIYM